MFLAIGGEAFGKSGVPFAGGPHHDQSVFAWNQIGAGAEDHPLQCLPRTLQRQHLPFHREHGQLRHQLLAPGATAEHRLLAAQLLLFSFGAAQMDAAELSGGLPLQIKHFGPFHELHAQGHAGPLQGPHQLPAVVDLAVLLEQQPGAPLRPQAWDFPLKAGAVQGLPKAGGGVSVPLGRCSERHHDAAGAQAAAQAAVRLDLRHPAGDQREAGLTQLQQVAAQAFGMGRQHPCSHKACRFAAAAADHGHALIATGQLMGNG